MQKNKLDNTILVRFHFRNAMAFLLVLTGMIVSYAFLMTAHYQKSEKIAQETLIRNFKERVTHLDNLLKGTTDHISDMRTLAEADLLETCNNENVNMPFAYNFFDDAGNYFHLNDFHSPFTKEMFGNLTGEGGIQKRTKDFYREIRMALNLSPLFRSGQESIKTSAWLYYISKRNFIYLYPWISSEEWKFTRESFNKEFYTLALPKNNSDKNTYWTKLYVDEVGIGLMTSCGAPIYDNDKFLGAVALDLTVDFLNSIVGNFRPEHGVMFLVNDRGQLLAHPELTSSKDKSVKNFNDAIPPSLKQLNIDWDYIPSNKINYWDEYMTISADLKNAPWKAYYLEPISTLSKSFFDHIGINAIILLIGIFGLVIVVLTNTHLSFVKPAEKFVNFILKRNKGLSSDFDKKVPLMWKPWFRIVEDTFSANMDLTQKLQKHSESMETQVIKRTAELEEANTQLREEIDERKRAETALRLSEEKVRNIVENSTNLFYSHTIDNEITYISPQCREFLQCEPEEAMLKWTEFATDNPINKKGFELTELAIKTGLRQRPYELELVGLKGKILLVEVREAPIVIDGKTTAIVGSLTDITERRRGEQEKAKLQSQLTQAQKVKAIGTLAGGIAHDFNNMLGIITGNVSYLLNRNKDNEELVEVLSDIQEGAQRSTQLTQQLLTFAKGGAPIKKTADINTIIKESANFFTRGAKAKCDYDLSDDLWDAEVDSGQINQVISNLVVNANQAMPNGGIITIRSENTEIDADSLLSLSAGRYVKISLKDHGVGISEKHLPNIFDPYFSTKQAGSGLGLATSYSIIKRHDGHISVESKIDKGTTFSIYLPASEKAILKAEEKDAINYFGKGKILIMDDEEPILKMAGRMLSEMGYEPYLAKDGEEAIGIYQNTLESGKPFDLVVLDLTIPGGMGGQETIQKLLKIDPNVQAVVSSGYSNDPVMSNYKNHGFVGVIPKPYSQEQVAEVLNEILSEKE